MFVGLTMSLPMLMHPSVPLLQWTLSYLEVDEGGDIPFDVAHGPGEKVISFSTRDALTKLTNLRREVLGDDLMSISMIHGAVRLGDMIDRGGHRASNVPLMEFARHFRNACAHGDRWHFRNGEPKSPAACRELVLTADLQGQRATFVAVSPRRYVEFLDDVSNHFLPGSVPPPVETD